MRSKWTGLGIAVALAALIGSYQNCAQNPGSSKPAETEEVDHLVRAMETPVAAEDERAITSQKVAASPECRVENLRCFRKVYSPEVQDLSGNESICLDGTCLDVQTHSYNTRDALAACAGCGEQSSAPGGEYNREEYTCWLGEPGQPSAEAFALRSTFADAVKSTIAACSGDLQ